MFFYVKTLVRAVRGRELRSAIRLQSAKMIGQLCNLSRASTGAALSTAIRNLLKDAALEAHNDSQSGSQIDETTPVVSKLLATVGANVSNVGGTSSSSAATNNGSSNKKGMQAEEDILDEQNADLLAGEVRDKSTFSHEVSFFASHLFSSLSIHLFLSLFFFSTRFFCFPLFLLNRRTPCSKQL